MELHPTLLLLSVLLALTQTKTLSGAGEFGSQRKGPLPGGARASGSGSIPKAISHHPSRSFCTRVPSPAP